MPEHLTLCVLASKMHQGALTRIAGSATTFPGAWKPRFDPLVHHVGFASHEL